jgi:corrinoid protein of di/trimethylamine methyltransferase
MEEQLGRIRTAVEQRNKDDILPAVQAALDAGIEPKTVINQGLIAAMDVVGAQFGEGEIFVPEMLVSAMLMKQGLEKVKPLIAGDDEDDDSLGLVLMGTVKGDLHDIGKNIVVMMLEGAGFRVVDLGVDLAVEQVADKVSEMKPKILGLSALLTTTMPEMKKVIEELTERGLRDQLKIIVGGAPVDEAFADKIGADGYGKDAAEAVSLAKKMAAA